MLLEKTGLKNYFVVMLVLLGATTVLVILAFLIRTFFPDVQGRNTYNYELTGAYNFEPWYFEVEGFQVHFPEGGVIATVHETDMKRSVLLIGDALYLQKNTRPNSEQIGGLFMVVEHSLFEILRGGNIFTPLEIEAVNSQLDEIIGHQKGIPSIWENAIPITFHARAGLVYHYPLTIDGLPILPPVVSYSPVNMLGTFLTYILFTLIMLLIILILSPDHRYSRDWIEQHTFRPGSFGLALVPVVIVLVLAGGTIMAKTEWPDFTSAAAYFLAISVLLLSSRYRKISFLDLGLRRNRLKYGYLLAALTAILIVGSIRGLPPEVDLNLNVIVIQFPLIFLLFALPHEMIWRGYIQTTLSRRFGINQGLIVMIILAAVTRFVFLLTTEPWMLYYPYTYLETAVLVPGLAAIIGLIYLRTENVLACALLHSLVIFLPQLYR